jgi:hypothetical protein
MLESQLQLNGALDALSPGETMPFINVSDRGGFDFARRLSSISMSENDETPAAAWLIKSL